MFGIKARRRVHYKADLEEILQRDIKDKNLVNFVCALDYYKRE